jgi:hypothetical protein
MDISGDGDRTGPGNASTIVCAAMCASKKAASGNRVLQSSTPKQSKPLIVAGPNVAMMLASKDYECLPATSETFQINQ